MHLIDNYYYYFGRLLPDFLTSAHHDSSLLVIAHILQLDHDSGTAYLKTFTDNSSRLKLYFILNIFFGW